MNEIYPYSIEYAAFLNIDPVYICQLHEINQKEQRWVTFVPSLLFSFVYYVFIFLSLWENKFEKCASSNISSQKLI